MNQYMNALIYIALGLAGASGHYLKKRYVDHTTTATFLEYLQGNPMHTLRAIGGIAFAEMQLSFLQIEHFITLQELVGAVTAGYMFDSSLNKAPDA